MDPYLQHGEQGIMFTTLKVKYRYYLIFFMLKSLLHLSYYESIINLLYKTLMQTLSAFRAHTVNILKYDNILK